jgi:hypothetical protein
MEFVPGSGNRYLTELGGSGQRVLISDRLLTKQTLGAYVFPSNG